MAARRRAWSHRTDRLSAAYRNLQRTDDEAAAYAAFCQHYGLEPTRNNAGVSHENGSVEAAHGHLKIGLKEAPLRGCRDFPDLASYQAFLAEFVMRKNARRRTAVETELKVMRPLPLLHHRLGRDGHGPRSATVSVRGVLYTVPSRLIGSRLKVHIYDDRLVCWLGTTLLLTLPRRHYKRGAPRQRVVDYRHLIGALVRKPQAFRRSIFRDELFLHGLPARLGSDRRSSGATQGVPGLCRAPAPGRHACPRRRSLTISRSFSTAARCRIWRWRAVVAPPPTHAPQVSVRAPDLGGYDQLLEAAVV